MAGTVKASYTGVRNQTLITGFGPVVIDADGLADVPDGMGKRIAKGDYGPAWKLVPNGVAKSAAKAGKKKAKKKKVAKKKTKKKAAKKKAAKTKNG